MDEYGYYCIQLTREELDEISIALKARIETLKETLAEVHSLEAKDVIGRTLKACISAQKETTYAGQPERYIYNDENTYY